MYLTRVLLFIILIFAPAASHCAPIESNAIPAQLAPWQAWVLFGQEDRLCTPMWQQNYPAAQADVVDIKRQCRWPGELNLILTNAGGTFEQFWQLDRDGWIVLPGTSQYWPQKVKLNNQPALVMRNSSKTKSAPGNKDQDRPMLYVPAGQHLVTGSFSWSQLPQNLAVDQHSAIIKLSCNDTIIDQPRLEGNGLLWLQDTNNGLNSTQDKISVQVFRQVSDSIPLVLTTNIQLEISGKERELRTGIILPPDFIPLAINSPLPARLETDGSLRLMAQPGRWTIEISARHLGSINTLTMPEPQDPWPAEEIWSIQSRKELRVISVTGVKAIDPAQTSMPPAWKKLPAYLLQPGQKLQLVTGTRGASDSPPEQINLKRTLWLDFDGSGYSAQDVISGHLSSRSRLEAGAQLALGRVTIQGKDQFITQLSPTAPAGVEIRQDQLQLEAQSRIIGDLNQIPAVGWAFTPTTLQTQLNLPPGWRLIAAIGPDSASSTWLGNWSLLDIFIVLVLALSFGRLWGVLSGLGALVALALIYHEPNAPQLVWLNVLIPIALLRVLPGGRIKQLTQCYRNAGLLLLLVVCLVFTVQQVRSAIYPQLEPQIARYHQQKHADNAAETLRPQTAMLQKATARAIDNLASKSRRYSASLGERKFIPEYDPELNIQTGPGIPKWQWRSVMLRWNGPVTDTQMLQLYLLPPLATRILLLSGIALLALMFMRLLSSAPLPRWKRPTKKTVTTAVLLCTMAAGITAVTVQPARAEFPPPEMLEQLQQRLLEPPSCYPDCIALNELAIDADQHLLRLRMSYHCQSDQAVPLPLPAQQLHVLSARLNKTAPAAIYRDDHENLWAKIPKGIHTLELHLNLPPMLQRFQLPLSMPAGMVHINAPKWIITGAQDGSSSHGAIDFSRQATTAVKQLQPDEIQPFVEVRRELYLGFDWHIKTTVKRISQGGSAAILHIPLLANEQVTSRGVTIENNQVLVNLAPQATSYSWESNLEKTNILELLASHSDQFNEVWQLRAEPIWHIVSSGTPVIHYYRNGQWQQQWQPWPGEKLLLEISRPNSVKGQLVTIDSSQLTATHGNRTSEVELQLQLRSSHGSEHSITLPESATLKQVTINGRTQPIKQQQRLVTLPLVPGAQKIVLKWQQQQGIDLITTTPQVHLGAASVDSKMTLNLPHNRWVLFSTGPMLGPAVLFWGVLGVILLLAFILGRTASTPLRWWHWLLLLVGLSQASLPALIPVVAWLLLLGLRQKWQEQLNSPWSFNASQLVLIMLSVIAMLTILGAIKQGLLGLPQMQIAGNNSSAWNLHWYQDRCTGFLPEAWVLSVPMYIYRLLMLLWALWLALALLKWLQWGWTSFSSGGLWRKLPPRAPRKDKASKKDVPPQP
jgi:hypothetical protein